MATISSDQIVAEAQKFLGDTYVYGADGPNTFDCSGLVEYVYKNLGLSVPRTSEAQFSWSQAQSVSADQLQPGDLVFYTGSDGTTTSPGHVAIFVGDGKVIHAPHTGTVVKTANINDIGTPVGYKRMPNVVNSTTSTGSGVTDTGFVSGLLSFPTDITNFFKGATDDLTATAQAFSLFFQPTTYIRIGAGIFGLVFLLVALIFMVREAQK